jgi:hypothetical protein
MASCPNCKATMTCGCQKRTLPNGKIGCTSCVNKKPSATVSNKEITTAQTVSISTVPVQPAPVKTVYNNNVWGPDRYKNLNKF